MTRPPMICAAVLLACASVLPSVRAIAQPAEPGPPVQPPAVEQTTPAQPTLIVRDLVVLHTDRYGQRANDPSQIHTTLFAPISHRGRFKRIDDNRGYQHTPMPVGLITFQGKIDQPMRIRMDLPAEEGFFHAHWPNDAQKGERKIDWFQVQEPDGKQRAQPINDADHWLAALRESEDRLWLRTRDELRKERFMLYDASMPFTPQLSLSTEAATYQVKNDEQLPTPAMTLLVHQVDEGWATDIVTDTWNQGTARIASKPTTSPTVNSAKQALAPLAEQLTQRGYNENEIDIALGMVSAAGLNKSGMSLVYILPEGEIDKYIWLRFSPEPDQVIRTAIVVVTNIDPDLGSRVEALVLDLGSDQWLKRDRAQRELINMGRAAIQRIQALREHTDPEVAFRARQILAAYDLSTKSGR